MIIFITAPASSPITIYGSSHFSKCTKDNYLLFYITTVLHKPISDIIAFRKEINSEATSMSMYDSDGRLLSVLLIKRGKVVPVLKLIKHYAMKAYGRVDV
jgi:hypothetical protein